MISKFPWGTTRWWEGLTHYGDSAASQPLKEVMVSASATVAGSWFHSGIVLNMVERQRGDHEERWLAPGLSRRWSPFWLFCWVLLMFTSSGGMAKCPFIILYSKMSLWSRRRFARSFHPRSRRRPITLTVPYWLPVHRADWRWIRSSADWYFCRVGSQMVQQYSSWERTKLIYYKLFCDTCKDCHGGCFAWSRVSDGPQALRGDGRYVRLLVY